MTPLNKDEIHIIGRNSNLSQESTQKLLDANVYSSTEKWKSFIQQFTLFTGIGFIAAGVIFFFAYNWDDLHKVAKIGILEFSLLAVFISSFFSKKNKDLKNGLLLLCSILIGVLYAVFGQIYQTGANAYDFFFGWTISVALWAIIANFPPLQLIFVILSQTTLYFYSEQVANWQEDVVYLSIGLLGGLAILINTLVQKISVKHLFPNWYKNTLVIISLYFITAGAMLTQLGFLKYNSDSNQITIISTVFVIYLLVCIYAFITKNVFYIGSILLSSIIILTTYFVRHFNDDVHLLFLSLFIIISVSLSIALLVSLQKQWSNGEQ